MYSGVINYKRRISKKKHESGKFGIQDDKYQTREEAVDGFKSTILYASGDILEYEVIMYETDLPFIASQYSEEKGVNDFYIRIAFDTGLMEYRNPINSEYWKFVWGDIMDRCVCEFDEDPVRLEHHLISHIIEKHPKYRDTVPYLDRKKIMASYSVKELSDIVNGNEWTNEYREAMGIHLFTYLIERFNQLRDLGLQGKSIQDGDIQEVIARCRKDKP